MRTAAQHTPAGNSRQSLPVCLVERDPNHLNLARYRIEQAGFPVVSAISSEEALQKVRRGACRLVIADLGMPGMDGLTLLDKTLQHDPEIHVILTTEVYSAVAAIEAIKRGAYDYLCKPIDFSGLEKTLDEVADIVARRAETRLLEEKLFEIQPFEGKLGKGPEMIEVFELAKRFSHHHTDVLVSGPKGVGKELVARALHGFSAVAHQPFTVCDCAALADALLDGSIPGVISMPISGGAKARAGASSERPGGGTFFLEEISETSLSTQAKLLAAMRTRDASRPQTAGGVKMNLRIIAATSRSLRAEVIAGRFREDLFLQLAAVEIRIPGLSERPEDISALLHHSVRKHNRTHGKRLQGVTRRAQVALLQYDWPGNVREIDDVIAIGAAATQGEWIDLGDLPEHLHAPRRAASSGGDWQPAPLDEMRRIHIERMLELCKGNRVRAARILGIGRTSLYRFLKRSASQEAAARLLS